MKHLKTFENNNWQDIENQYDVYQLMEIIIFKYGKEKFMDLLKDINEEESDYNPDEFYEQIKFVLDKHDLLNDFIENYEEYQIEKDENDPYHWRHRQKEQEKLSKGFN